MSDLSRIGSATCVLGSDTELQAVYRDVALSEVNPGSIHKGLVVKQADFARTPPTPSVNKPKLSVVAMKPAVTRLAFPDGLVTLEHAHFCRTEVGQMVT
jgi:hypothetical protein